MSLADNAARMIREKGGSITLTRTALAASDPATPWVPGASTETVYTVDAFVTGVTEQFIDGTTVLASDLMVVMAPKATLAGSPVDIAPLMTDTLTIGGTVKAIKRIAPAPVAGPPALYRIFVAS